MLEWNFSPNVEKTFIDYHVASMNEPEFSFSQIYRYQHRKPMSNNNYSLIDLDYSWDLNNSFEKALSGRKTCVSQFKNSQKITKQLISKFCNLAFVGSDGRRRAYPSGGSEYNIRIHIIFNEENVNSEMVELGNITEVNCDTGKLMIKRYQPWQEIATAFVQKYLTNKTQFSIVLSIDINSISKKYHDISYRMVQQEAGHIGQNIQLVSQYLGIQSVPLGGFYDTMIGKVLNEKQTVLYTFLLG